MIQINCMIATPEIKDMAAKLGKSVVVTTNAVATWLSENNTAEIPTLEQLKDLFKQAELEHKDYYLSLPNAITTPYEVNGNPITHVDNKIIMMQLPAINSLDYFYNVFKDVPELRDLVLEPQEAYYFMLWRELLFIINNWEKTSDNIKLANKEAIARLKEYKKQNPHTNERLTEEHHTVVRAINNYIAWAEEHVTLDKATHTYYVDGVPVDFSVSQYYESIYADSPNFGDKYAESPAVGDTMDAIWRDYFDDTKRKTQFSRIEYILNTSYPNMNSSRKEQVLRDLDRFKIYLDGRFGEGLYKVITNPKFHLVARFGDKTIAGTPDMVVIDKDGNPNLFDMKAKSHPINQTYNGQVVNDARNYTAQLNLYRVMMEIIPSMKKLKSLQLIWMDTNITSMRHNGNFFNVDKKTEQVTVSNGKLGFVDQPIEMNPEWNTPSLNSIDVSKSIIPLGILPKVRGLIIPKMSLYSDIQTKNNQTMKQQMLPGPDTKINIYAGTGENANLSNFTIRPFEVNEISFQSVEQGFQYSKFDVLKQVINSGYTERDAAYNDVMQKIEKIQRQLLDTKRNSFNTDKDFGAKLKSIGGTRITAKDSDLQMIINNFFAKEKVDGFTNWEKGTTASNAMKMLIKASFQDAQNSQALQRLLSTGNATLTHTQGKGKWGTEFPKLLMEVREELRGENSQTGNRSFPKVEVFNGYWTREQVANQQDKVFLFGDNTNDRVSTHYVPSSTQAVIRGLPNAIGIDTKKDRGTGANSYFSDADFDQFKAQVDSAINTAKADGRTIVIPADGIGTGKAILKEKAPKCFEYLQGELQKLQQNLLSSIPVNSQNNIDLIVTESSGDYSQRTKENADWSDITLALATDFSTPGETLTAQQAGSTDEKYLGNRKPREGVEDKYHPISIANIKGKSGINATSYISSGNIDGKRWAETQKVKEKFPNGIKLNIAGNGIYTLIKEGITQEEVNDYLEGFLFGVKQTGVTISEIRSGGQTGIDEAGIIAAQRLGIKTSVHAPKGFKFRGEDGKDISDKERFLSRFNPQIRTSDKSEAFGGVIANTSQEIKVPKYVEVTNYLPYNRPDVTVSKSNFTVKETPQAKLTREFSPNERTLRVEGIARDFSRAIDNAAAKLIANLEKELQATRDNKDYSETLRLLAELESLKDEKNGRKEVIERYTPKQLALDVLQLYKDVANMTPEEADAIYGEGRGVEIISKNQKVVDNFYPLLDEATIQIEWHEGFRLIYENTEDSSAPRGAIIARTEEEQEAIEREFGDDEEGNRVNGSEGWSFQMRFINPHTTVTNRVKRVLSNILYQSSKGLENDDLGKPRYMPEIIVYGTLINELVNMSNSDDFAIKNDKGKYEFPALNAMLPKYPWVKQIIIALKKDPQLVSQFYAAFRKEFIPYWMQYFKDNKRVTLACNRTLAEDNIISDLYATYNKGLNDSTFPIYDITGNPIRESAERLQILLNKVYSILNSFNDSQKEDLAQYISDISLSLGIKVEKALAKGITESENAEGSIRNWANAVNKIVQDILNKKVPEKVHFVDHFKDQYKIITETIGTVSELANVLSFRQGDKSYYSISASNFLYTMIKKFKRKDFEKYIEDEYKQFKWFYNEKLGGWMNGWVEELLENPETRKQLELREHVFYKDKKGNLKEYNQWTPQDIEDIFLTEYWSVPSNQSTTKQYAMFNLPIPSDSEQALFIKFSKFSGAHYQDRIIEGLRKVVLQELTRIKLVRDRLAKKAPEIMYFDKNGLKFQFFPRFNDLNVLDEWMPYLDNEDFESLNNAIREALRTEMNLQWQEYQANSKLNKEEFKKYLVQQGTMKESENIDTYIEEYYWNNAYAQTQILQLTIIDPALYKDGNDLQKRFKEIIASGTKLFTNSKYGRKTEYTIYLKDQIGISSTYNNIKEVLNEAVNAKHIQTYDRDNILYLFRNVNATDAQAYRTSSSYRAIIDMLQGWSNEMETAIQHFENGTWNMADFNMVWQTLKPFMFTHIPKDAGIGTGEKIKVGHQNKNSEFLLLAMYNLVSQSMGKSDKIIALNKFMEDYNIDVAQFISSVKTGGETVVDITYYPPSLEAIKYDSQGNESSIWKRTKEFLIKEKGAEKVSSMSDIDIYREGQEILLNKGIITQEEYNTNKEKIEPTEEETLEMLKQQVLNEDGSFKENVVHALPYEDYVIQQPTPEHLFDVASVFGSQFRNLITSDLPEDFTITINGITLNKEQTIRLYQGCIVENLLEDYKNLKKEFVDIEDLQKMLMSQIKGNPKYSRDMLNVLEIVEYIDPRDEKIKKTFNIPLNAPNITDILQELLLSCFKNNITKQYIKGGACIAVSNFGFTDELKIHYNKEGDKTSGIAYMDCYLPWYSKKYFEPFMKEVTKTIEVKGKKKTVTYPELDYKELEKQAPELLKIIGFRIPTEAKYSMFPLRIAGFLPQQNGSCIMLPMEATTLSGMDFDVDKVFLMIPEFREVPKYNMKKAWEDFYNDKPDIRKKINEAKKADAKFSQVLNESYSELSKKLQEGGIDTTTKLKDYEYVEGVLEEFKKWFKEHRNTYYTHSEIKKVGYDLNKENPSELTAQNLNRAQRNNLIIDIAYGILSHPQIAEHILNPGNFNTLKLMSRVASITEDEDMMQEFMEEFRCTNRKEVGKKLLEFIKTKNLEVLDKFVKNHLKEKNPLSPLTFAYYHQQNMVGAALIGMYANNTTAQAKFQQANGFGIASQFDFRINGRDIRSLSEISTNINDIQERISKMCSEWSAASVDNVKDPVLAMLLQNTKTANIAGTLIRAGISIEEVSMLFRQPIIVKIIKDTGSLNEDDLKENITGIYNRLAELEATLISQRDIIRNLKTDGISSEDLMNNIVSEEDINDSTDVDYLNSQLTILTLFKNLISPIAQDMSELTKISRADSPNGAIAPSLSEAKIQIARLNRFLSRRTGDDKFALRGLERVLDANVNTNMSIDELRTRFFESKMPMLQAFYSLGIEFGTHLIKDYFPQMEDSISTIIDTVLSEVSDYWGFGPNDNLKQVYQDLTTFALTKTKLFGDDDTNTFWDKYTYYIYEFPKHFMEAVNSNPEVAQLAAIKRMEVKGGTIVFNRAGRLDKSVRESYIKSLDSLLYMDGEIKMTKDGQVKTYPIQKLAVDLFMYAFYNEGFKFGPNNYSIFLSSSYLTAFPEFVEALRNIGTLMSNSNIASNFLEQLWANRGNKMAIIVKDETEDKSEIQELPDKSINVKPEKVINRVKNNGSPYKYIRFNNTLYELNIIGPLVYNYIPSTVISRNRVIYNANQTALQISESQINPKVVEDARNSIPLSQEDDLNNVLDNMSTVSDVNAMPTEVQYVEDISSFDSEQLEAFDKVSSIFGNEENLIAALNNQESTYELQIEERISGESLIAEELRQYDINESNQQFKDPMCTNVH